MLGHIYWNKGNLQRLQDGRKGLPPPQKSPTGPSCSGRGETAPPPPQLSTSSVQLHCLGLLGLPTLWKKSGGSLKATGPEETDAGSCSIAPPVIHFSTEVYLGTIVKHGKGHHPEPGLLLCYEGVWDRESIIKLGSITSPEVSYLLSDASLLAFWDLKLFLSPETVFGDKKKSWGRGLSLCYSCCSMHDAQCG